MVLEMVLKDAGRTFFLKIVSCVYGWISLLEYNGIQHQVYTYFHFPRCTHWKPHINKCMRTKGISVSTVTNDHFLNYMPPKIT